MSGTAALCPEFRHFQDGLELADSYAFNPHKWMFTNFDCDCFWVADRAALIKTLSILPEYLKNQATESGAVFDYRDWHVQLGRRFRSLKLWFVIRHYGVEGLQHHVRQHVELAQQFAGWVAADPRFELAAPAPLNLVCFRHRGGDEANRTLAGATQQQRRPLPDAHRAVGPLHPAPVRRPDLDRSRARPARLAAHPAGGLRLVGRFSKSSGWRCEYGETIWKIVLRQTGAWIHWKVWLAAPGSQRQDQDLRPDQPGGRAGRGGRGR